MLFERLRIPSIAGLILAGLLVGPHGFHLLDRDASFELFGKVGIYYIMFLASLEMNMQDVRQTRGKAVGFGLLSFAIPILLGCVANSVLLHYAFLASLLMASMYASHTLISYPIVLRYGLARRQSVTMAVGGTVVADTLTLLVLAVVSETFTGGELTLGFWLWLLLKLALIGFVIIEFFPRAARFFFKRYNDGVIQYIFVLGLVFLGAGLMEFVGMEGILGAFLVGIVLNRSIPATSPLMNHIEFIGNAIFIPYFLIGVGMLVDMKSLFDMHALEVAGVMILVGTLGKWLAARTAQHLYHLSPRDGTLLFGLTNSRAAATLAIVIVGNSIVLPDGSRLLGEAVLNGAMLLILASCIVSSFFTEKMARSLASKPEVETTAHKRTYREKDDRIVIALSNPSAVDTLVNFALMVRRPMSTAPLSAINIVLEQSEEPQAQGSDILEKAARIAAAAHVRMQTHSRWSVNVVSGLSHSMKELDATDLIIGLHSRQKIFESFYGKIATDLIDAVNRQIIVYRSDIPVNTLRRIHLVVPRKAEYEPGFRHWADRIARLSSQLGCMVDVYGAENSLTALREHWEHFHPSLLCDLHEYNSWNDYFSIANRMHQDHLVVFVMARPGSISYHNYFQRLPDQFERYFSQRSLALILPDQFRGTIGKTSVLISK
ncbi:MAG: cation:proton antiporter [Alloprevotella sp.]|nr:cation:proton antiporter [Alloprevotella sp.]